MDSSTSGNRLMRLRQVMQTTGLARSTIYKLMAKREFPLAIKVTTKSVAWPSLEVDAWIASRAQSRYRPR